MACSCGNERCEPAQSPGSKTPCMTCGQPYGNHCYGVHCELQFCAERFNNPDAFRAKADAARAIRMDQMGWTEADMPSPEQQNKEAVAMAIAVGKRYGIGTEES